MPTQTSNPSTCATMHRPPICLTCLNDLHLDPVEDPLGGVVIISCVYCNRYDYVGITGAAMTRHKIEGSPIVHDNQFPPHTPREWLRYHHARAQQSISSC